MNSRPHLDKYRARARKAAIRQRLQRIRKNIVVRMVTRAVITMVWAVVLVVSGYHIPKPMELPMVGEPVVAWTGPRWYKACVDENGEFRDCETGLSVGQVIKWERP